MLVWATRPYKAILEFTIFTLRIYPFFRLPLSLCGSVMSLLCLATVSAVSLPSHGPGKTADFWNASGSLSFQVPNASLFGARAGSTQANGPNPKGGHKSGARADQNALRLEHDPNSNSRSSPWCRPS